jgi:hypothetical protein
MTDFPELQAALVDAAGRRYGRRRRRLLRPVGGLVAASAAAAAAVAVIASLGGTPDVEEPAPPAKPVVRLEQRFEVFRRPPTAADRLPAAEMLTQERVHAKRARLVAELGNRRVFMVPARRDWVCVIDVTGNFPEGSVCGPVAAAADERNPTGQFGPHYVQYVFPDGVHDVRLTLSDGRLVRPEVRTNAILVKVAQEPYSLTWVGASGDLYGTLLDRVDLGRPECAELQRLPANASVRSTAQLAARAFYPGSSDPRVVEVVPAGPNAGGCGAETEGRVVAALLTLDPGGASASGSLERLLVGQANGRLVVWQP